MSGFWEKKPGIPKQPVQESQPIEFDEQAMAELQEDPNVDIFEEEEEDTISLMQDASLRLQQGHLYQLVLQGDIFADTDADPRAIKNVQREIRRFVRERMEIMLGIRQEQAQETIVSSPFNDMEVNVLKMLASKMSKGATEQIQQAPTPAPATPKRDGISSISGNLKPKQAVTAAPVKTTASKPATKPKQVPVKSAINSDETLLTKPIAEMSPQELADYEKKAAERRAQNKSAIPQNLVPHPTPQALEMLYTGMAQGLNISGNRPYRLE